MVYCSSNHTLSPFLLSSCHAILLVLFFCDVARSFMVLVNQNIHNHGMEFKRRRSKSNMFSLEVMFRPSVEPPLNQQRRSKMHRSYHRRNVHKMLYIDSFLLSFPPLVSVSLSLSRSLCILSTPLFLLSFRLFTHLLLTPSAVSFSSLSLPCRCRSSRLTLHPSLFYQRSLPPPPPPFGDLQSCPAHTRT